MHKFLIDTGTIGRCCGPKRTPLGLTRLELVLMLCVIALNVILFLPFVEQSREVARRHQCQQNLKQIGLALHMYHDTYDCFPSGFDVNPDGSYLGWGWNLKILPWMDAASIYHQVELHFSEGFQGLPDTSELKQRIPTLRCPSDPGSETVAHAMICTGPVADGIVSPRTVDWQNRLCRSNYFGNAAYLQLKSGGIQYNSAGVPTSVQPLTNGGSLGQIANNPSPNNHYCDQAVSGGVFGQNSRVQIKNFIEGTANKFMIGERYSPTDTSANSVGHGTWVGVPDCTSTQGLAMALADTSIRMNIGLPRREQTTGFGSLHSGGANFVFGDGSLRFISNRIDTSLYRKLSVIDDCAR